jgi:ATP-dependent Clp protease ATP-binding subunit ClpX
LPRVAIDKKTGARGLRSILEQTMLDVMYDIPADEKIAKCVVTKAAIEGVERPKLIEGERKKPEQKDSSIKSAKDIENAS